MKQTEKIIISNPKEFEKKKTKISLGGLKEFHIVSDFDRTLTKAFVKGQKQATAIAQLREGGYLTPDYPEKAYALHDKYYPIEINPNVSKKEKNEKMVEWWSSHLNLMLESNLTKNVIEDVIKKNRLTPREGMDSFFKFINSKKIPCLILSAGLGDIIEAFLRERKVLEKNIHIISNFFSYDSKGKVIGYKSKIIHTFNKNEAQISGTRFAKEVENKKNLLLLGDGIGDLDMAKGISHETIIKIGFLNEDLEKNIDVFKKEYDVLILEDGSMNFVNSLLQELFE
jgi:cytosolic 5'-nucleotidase 3